MMMSSVELYRTLERGGRARDGLARGRLAAARLVGGADGGARAPGGLGADVRPSARADLGRRGAGLFPPMSTDGVLGAAYLPTDGYIDPSQLTFALAEGARRRRRRDQHEHARDRDRRRARPGHAASRPTRARSRPRSSSTPAACSRREIGAPGRRHRADRPDGARVPDHAAERPSARPADDARPVAPRLLPRRVGRARDGRLRAQPGALGARRHPGRLQRPAARRGLGPLRGADAERDRARARRSPTPR